MSYKGMSDTGTNKRGTAWQRLLILVALSLWVIQMILAGIVIASPAANNDWRLSQRTTSVITTEHLNG